MFTNEHLASYDYYGYLKVDRPFINLDVSRSNNTFPRFPFVQARARRKGGLLLSDITFYDEERALHFDAHTHIYQAYTRVNPVYFCNVY